MILDAFVQQIQVTELVSMVVWQVWETNSPAIVMVTGLVEGKKQKCARYWPAQMYNAETGDGGEVFEASINPASSYASTRTAASDARLQRLGVLPLTTVHVAHILRHHSARCTTVTKCE